MAITKQAYEYSPSVNIKRDSGKNLRYIPTYNGQRAFEQIVQSAATGTRTFTIIGAYGSGKSTFLWALAETAAGRKTFFDRFDYLLRGYPKNQLLDLVGEFTSLKSELAKELKCNHDEVIQAITQYAEKLQKKQTALIIRIDEYGKFLEYAAKHNPQDEIYFVQQLAELANDAKRNILLITTLHQDFGAYAFGLSEQQRNEWTKVKGRFKEITFNEPAEQLLFIAANRLNEIEYSAKTATLKKLLQTIEKAKAFPLKDYFTPEVAQQLAPIELLAGSALTIGLQRYGQNERSFFSFIEAQDYQGLYQFIQAPDAPLYYLPHVYDYLIYHYYSPLTAQHNPDHRAWRLMRDNIEKAESIFDTNLNAALVVIKTIGLLNLLGNSGARIDHEFLTTYLSLAGNIATETTRAVLKKLESHKLIRYRAYSNRYVLFEGTDVDIDLAIDEAGRLVEQVTDISQYLNSYFTFPVIPAKRYQIEMGTPRFFEVRLSDEPIEETPVGERDGFINLVFSTKRTEKDLIDFSRKVASPILYVYFKQIQHIRNQVHSVEKAKRAKLEHTQDIVAKREFDNIIAHHQNLLRYFVLDKFNTASREDVTFVFKGRVVDEIHNRRTLNNFLSTIAEDAYPSTPRYLNEMINKTKLSAAITTARKNLIRNLIDHKDAEDIGYPTRLFPPDKMIYMSLLKDKGFHRKYEEKWELMPPEDKSFLPLWTEFLLFLDSAKSVKRPLSDFVNKLLSKPFKIKKGLVDFLLPILLLTKRDSFALYYEDEKYVPELSPDTLDLVVKRTENYSVKAFDLDGWRLSVFNQYRQLANKTDVNTITNKSFVDTIIPFLSFYRDLPEFAKRTKKITKEAQHLREVIFNATDPEKAFFEEFPLALGYTISELTNDGEKIAAYFERLRFAIKEIQTSYTALLKRYEKYVVDHIIGIDSSDFLKWRNYLQNKFKSINSYLLPSYLKTFLLRINSLLDDKDAWLKSVAQAVLGKPFEKITDHEEDVLYSRFSQWYRELSNFAEIEQAKKDQNLQDAFRLELTGIDKEHISQIIEIPLTLLPQVEASEQQLKNLLTTDKKLNILILAKLLKTQLNQDE
ncbi:ATP-binding protein [Parapedobacter sp. ISTM3]|uniref:ATP-binding protein n=1 Tax=Parapedobacter sp. ISTM3 TaxID=2800130 RepID=UPI001903F682|nr:ATP-binding protein [Parapedobacter sp. ISTM3]MBK1442683.1 ATP-binding protein [Parapedobacter sp. ISTM3]